MNAEARPDRPIIAVVGPTATGKSGLAVALALRRGGEVVNADAMALYRGMDIGTAKLPMAQRHGIPHHLLDVLDVRQEASVAAYQQAARAELAAISARGHLPILAGGSGLYVRAALDRLDIPPTDPQLRAALEDELDRVGVDAMHARLGGVDPVAAQHIEPRNARRIVRALEVVELTGRPFSAAMPAREHVWPTVLIGLALERAAARAPHRRPGRLDVAGRSGRGGRRVAGPGAGQRADRPHGAWLRPSHRPAGR